jgi:transposase
MNATPASVDCYVTLELSRSKWLVGALLPGVKKISSVSVSGGDTDSLLAALNNFASKAAVDAKCNIRMRVCFEAGYDGFWLARLLMDRGIDTIVLDASSSLVSRRGRRVKTDRICIPSSPLRQTEVLY